MSPSTVLSVWVRLLSNLLRHRPTTQKWNQRTPREVKSSLKEFLAEVPVVGAVDEAVDVVVVVIVDVHEVEVSVVGRRLRPMTLLLESSP